MFGLKTTVETREHTGSYYAASANWQTAYPRMENDIEADVVVVGGGFTGVNTAVELVEKGYDVVLLEANRISWGATGRNGGQVIGGIGHDPERFEKQIGADGVKAIYRMGIAARDIIRERVEKYDIDCDLTWGYCDVALKPRHLKQFAEWRDFEKEIGNPHEYRLLDRDELKEYVNSDAYLGGLMNTANGHVHPLNLCIGEARAAERGGARIFEQSRVQEIVQGQRVRVRTDEGSVLAKKVVLAGNAYMGGLIPKLATRVLPSNSSVVATAPLPESMAQQLMPGNVAVCDPRTALDYFRLSADRRMLFGGLSNYTGLEPKDLEGTIRRKMEKVFPELTGIPIDYGWSGQMGIGLNRMPQLGRLADNIAYIQAYSGHGVAPTHMMAKITADMIDGKPDDFDVFARIPHWPFPGGKYLRRPALAVGMAYFKVKDVL
ncbi:FAD-dependent oxidoreductase [Halioglobus sp. HI00S01]|uniref:NAD(P)/FAD-dependent oxidoreductase n=1 Tax=Halioglobus sp. HI00S01 TaxID=1822214 RepID=UPI0007C2EC7C|nr:FAD-binding oxidoreductase [Halioglobus sp. HI00S01]KZX59295.1 FAD-dependent oxidoreductase [Halioglobus sp. HI00S01]